MEPNDAAPTDVGEPESWADLAENRPGRQIFAEADDLRSRTPVVKRAPARAFFIHTDEAAYRKGADGEAAVAARLRKLDDSWRVIHSIPIGAGGTDVDHLVIGPAGVFCLNTKNHRGSKVWVHTKAFKVNGASHNEYLRNSRSEGQRVSKLLSAACGFGVVVQPVLVVLADELTIKGDPGGVAVVGRKGIARWLSRRPITIDASQVDAIYAQARRSSTWV